MIAITTCVNYDDYLSLTLSNNKQYFDSVVIITSSEDYATQKLAHKHELKLLVTDRFYEEGAAFNKGRAINEALRKLKNQWICHFDADIWLTGPLPNLKELEANTIYGYPRKMCPDKNSWLHYLDGGTTKRWQQLSPSNFILDNQTINQYLPLGYAQIFYNAENVSYPENSKDASESDVRFSLAFEKQCCLPGHVIHLPSVGNYREGANWRGRITPRIN
jgi:hypothetical protein